MLNSNSIESIRKKYEEQSPHFPNIIIEKLVLRNILLSENQYFKNEWSRLNELAKIGGDEYLQAQKNFSDKWFILHPSGLHDLYKLPLYARVHDSAIGEGRIIIEVDLTGSMRKILSEIKSIVVAWRKEFIKRLNEGGIYPIEKNSISHGNIKNSEDFEDYYTYLNVWRAKNKNISWKDVSASLELGKADTARNHYRSAKRLIENGVPGLPGFPKER